MSASSPGTVSGEELEEDTPFLCELSLAGMIQFGAVSVQWRA